MSLFNGSINCSRKELELGITLNGGQSFRYATFEDLKNILDYLYLWVFRWKIILKNGHEHFRGVFRGTVWTLWQDEDSLNYIVHESIHKDANFGKMLHDYFQLDFSLQKNLEEWTKADSHFRSVHRQIGAVRILNQDVVENLFSFICSSNNNITR